jgi:long-subunit acyl-CoA synthetase (AMP-forming)
MLKENYDFLQKSLNDGVDKNDLLEIFKKDAMLSFILLSYAIKEKGCGIKLTDALEKISNEELKKLFTQSSSRLVFVENQEYKDLLKSSVKVANSTYNIFKNLEEKKSGALKFDAEEYYVLGLLANFGKLILSGFSKEQKNELDNVIADLEKEVKDYERKH